MKERIKIEAKKALDKLFENANPKQTWKMYLASLSLWYEHTHILSQMAKILSSLLYQAVEGKIILGCVTFLDYVTLPSQGKSTKTDVVNPAWLWLPSNCCT